MDRNKFKSKIKFWRNQSHPQTKILKACLADILLKKGYQYPGTALGVPNIISYRGGIRFFNRYGAFRHTVALLTTQSIGKLSPTNARMSFYRVLMHFKPFTALIIEKEKGAENWKNLGMGFSNSQEGG